MTTTFYPYAPYHHLPPDPSPPSYLPPPQQRPTDHAPSHYDYASSSHRDPTDPNEIAREHNALQASTPASRFIQAQHQNPTRLHAAPYPLPSAREQVAQHWHVPEDMNDRPAKRRRSEGPNWDEFYRNGRPSEVIVIEDDTPEPESKTTAKPTKTTASSSNTTSQATNGTGQTSASQQTTKQPLPKEVIGVTSPERPKRQPALHTASQTSTNHNGRIRDPYASLQSSSTSQVDSVQPFKRKRTRPPEATETTEAKRRKIDVDAAGCYTYQPLSFPPKKAAEVVVKGAADPYKDKNPRVDDDDGHYIVVPERKITDRYQITKLLGQGTFGKVVQAKDQTRGEAVAIKVIRSVQKYRDASRIELRVLATLKANDEENRYRCIHFRDCFDFRGHICIVTDLLGQSVFDFLKGNGFVPFPMSQIQSFARQLLTSVAFLHGLNLIHTDLKPENILLRNDKFQTFTYNKRIPSSSTNVSRTAAQRRVLLDTEMRLIDFGSATFDNEYHSSVVSTRHYRAPEIVLGLGWSYPCDVWSIGCILVEFYTGDALFQTHDNLEHLAMMETVFNNRIDTPLVQKANRNTGPNGSSKYFKRLKLDYPKSDTKKGSVKFVKAMKQLEQIIPASNTFMRNFQDLLRKIFVYDPKKRITAEDALKHDFFQEVAYADDGTEAAKIRLENQGRENKDTMYERHRW